MTEGKSGVRVVCMKTWLLRSPHSLVVIGPTTQRDAYLTARALIGPGYLCYALPSLGVIVALLGAKLTIA